MNHKALQIVKTLFVICNFATFCYMEIALIFSQSEACNFSSLF